MIPVLHPDGLDALAAAPMAWTLLVGGTLIFIVMMVLLVLAVRGPARPVRPLWWLAGGGLVFPSLVLLALHGANLQHIERLSSVPPPGTPLLAVTARSWWWELRLEDALGPVTFANELVLPVGQPVHLALASNNVIHSLWVPALAGKLDLVPGRIQHLLLQSDKAGEWRGPCAEFCGQGHTQMVLTVVALPAADYAAWLANQRLPARAPATELQQLGLQHFVQQRCSACHTVRGVALALLPAMVGDGQEGEQGGPDLTHLASRRSIAAGTLRNDANNLRAWLIDPQQFKAGARMPAYGHLDPAALDALVAYLSSLQ